MLAPAWKEHVRATLSLLTKSRHIHVLRPSGQFFRNVPPIFRRYIARLIVSSCLASIQQAALTIIIAILSKRQRAVHPGSRLVSRLIQTDDTCPANVPTGFIAGERDVDVNVDVPKVVRAEERKGNVDVELGLKCIRQVTCMLTNYRAAFSKSGFGTTTSMVPDYEA